VQVLVAGHLKHPLPLPADAPPDDGELLSRIIRGLRNRRGLTVAEVAARMGMRPRTYQFFEAGDGNLNLTRIQVFSEAVDVDPWAILASLAFGSPDFAFACAENKTMTAAVLAARDFHRDHGDDVARLDPRVVMHEIDAAWDRLGEIVRGRRFPDPPDEPQTVED